MLSLTAPWLTPDIYLFLHDAKVREDYFQIRVKVLYVRVYPTHIPGSFLVYVYTYNQFSRVHFFRLLSVMRSRDWRGMERNGPPGDEG